MKNRITVSRALLQRALSTVSRVIRKQALLPVCSCMNIVCEGTTMTLTGTDSQAWLRTEIQLDTPLSARALVDAQKFVGAVMTAPEDAITLTFAESGERLSIKSGKSEYRLASTANHMAFPDMIDEPGPISEIELKGPALAKALGKVSYAAARGDIRAYLNGVAFQTFDQGINVVATNGHQLAKSAVSVDAPIAGKVNMILAVEYVDLIERLCEADKVVLRIGAKITVHSGPYVCQLPSVAGTYPDWERVVPKGLPAKLTTNRDALIAAVNRASYCWNEKQKGISLRATADSRELVITTGHEGNQVENAIEAENNGLDVALNGVYLKETLSVMESEDIDLLSRDANSSVLFKDQADSAWLAVIMPMRL